MPKWGENTIKLAILPIPEAEILQLLSISLFIVRNKVCKVIYIVAKVTYEGKLCLLMTVRDITD